MGKYFKYSALITVTFNLLNGFFNFIYCFYLVIDPHYTDDPNIDYIHHPSHIQRITSTVSWYIAKVSLIFFFSGRLYYAFNDTLFQLSFKYFIFINTFNLLFTPLSIFVAYYSVYEKQKILSETAFNCWRILYQFETFFISYIFSKRLLHLARTESEISPTNGMAHRKFLFIATKNTVLSFMISITVLLTTFCFFGFRFVFGKQTRLTLLIPMNMAAIDAALTSISILCFFSFGDKLYHKLCSGCNNICIKICYWFAKNYVHSMNSIMNLKSVASTSVISPPSPQFVRRNSVQLQLPSPRDPPVSTQTNVIDNIMNNMDDIQPRRSKLFELKVISVMTPVENDTESVSPLYRANKNNNDTKSSSAFLTVPNKFKVHNELIDDIEIVKDKISNLYSSSEPMEIHQQRYKHSKGHSIP